MSVGHKTNVGVTDWMVINGYQGSEDEEESPSTRFTTSAKTCQLTNPTMSHSTLCDGMPFEFVSGHVSGETITLWDRCNFPCAHVDSTVPYPSNLEVVKLILSAFVCRTD